MKIEKFGKKTRKRVSKGNLPRPISVHWWTQTKENSQAVIFLYKKD